MKDCCRELTAKIKKWFEQIAKDPDFNNPDAELSNAWGLKEHFLLNLDDITNEVVGLPNTSQVESKE